MAVMVLFTIMYNIVQMKIHKDILFILSTTITADKKTSCWFLINKDGTDESRHRFEWKGDILEGIVKYTEMVKHLLRKER